MSVSEKRVTPVRRGPLNICSECGKVNPPEAGACRVCAAALPGSWPPLNPPVAASPPRLPEPAPPPADPAPGSRTAPPIRFWVAVVLLIAVVAAVIAVALAPPQPPRRVIVRHRPAPALTTPKTRAPVATPKRAAVDKTSPLTPVETYWSAINGHRFGVAYQQLGLGSLSMDEYSFVTYEQSVGINAAHFAGRVVSASGHHAVVAVRTLVTEDRQFGCRSWSGKYLVDETGDQWLIARAELVSAPCG